MATKVELFLFHDDPFKREQKIKDETEFNFFHNDPTNYKEIRNSEDIFKNDLRFSQTIRNHSKAKLLSENPYSAPFVSGCVQIKKKSS